MLFRSFKDYFLKKFIDEFLVILVTSIIFFTIFYKGKKIKNNISFNYYYIILTILFLVWFMYHPALRYGGYYLLSLMIFLPIINFLSNKKFDLNYLKNSTLSLIFIAIIIFQVKNFLRINYEFKRYDFTNFPFYYFREDSSYERVNVGEGVYVSVATSSCMGAPTICLVGNTGGLKAKKYLGYNFYLMK